MAQEHNADLVLSPERSKHPLGRDITVPSEVLKATDGLGPDIAFDCAGIQASITLAIRSVRPRGTVMNIALWDTEHPAVIDMNEVLAREITITGAVRYYS